MIRGRGAADGYFLNILTNVLAYAAYKKEVSNLATVLNILFLLAAIGMIASVLLQSSKSAGLSGSLTGGANTLFGKKKGVDDLLAKLTVVFAVLFMVLAIALTSLSA